MKETPLPNGFKSSQTEPFPKPNWVCPNPFQSVFHQSRPQPSSRSTQMVIAVAGPCKILISMVAHQYSPCSAGILNIHAGNVCFPSKFCDCSREMSHSQTPLGKVEKIQVEMESECLSPSCGRRKLMINGMKFNRSK